MKLGEKDGGNKTATVRSPSRSVSIVREPVFRIHVERGPDQGRVFVLDGTQAPRVLLGTSPTCEVRLTDRQISRRHLSLELADGCLRVMELGSKNGTTARGVAIREVFLRGGETLELGDTVLTFSIDEEGGIPLVSDDASFGRYLGESVAMRRLYPICARLAKASIPVVIEGETGTGKELMGECLHEGGARATSPFVELDCATLTTATVERQLDSAIAEARGGTILFDEVSELDPAVQGRVLIGLEKQFRAHDIRIVATTRRDLDNEVAEGRLRDDLFFRISVARLELPPLRRRREDIRVLARRFWTDLGGDATIPSHVMARFEDYHWPGNIRELHNAVSRLVLLGDERMPSSLSSSGDDDPNLPAARPPTNSDPRDFLGAVIGEHLPLSLARQKVVDEFERRYVEDVFERSGRSVTKAAAEAGLARRYFRALRAKQRGSSD